MCGSMVDIQSATVEIMRVKKEELECGPMPNVMAALPSIGGASVQRRKVWLTPSTRVPCSSPLCDDARVVILLRHFCVLFFSASRVQHVSDLHAKFALRSEKTYIRAGICRSETERLGCS